MKYELIKNRDKISIAKIFSKFDPTTTKGHNIPLDVLTAIFLKAYNLLFLVLVLFPWATS